MKKIGFALVLTALVPFVGCENKKDVKVNAPGVKVETGPGGTRVETPRVDVDAGKGGATVDTPNREVEVDVEKK